MAETDDPSYTILYDDPRYHVDWKTIAVHDEQNVKGFFGPYRFLSNFHPAWVYFEGVMFPSTEHAYQAAKMPKEAWAPFTDEKMTAAQSKKAGSAKMAWTEEEWNSIRYEVMAQVVFDKFARHLELRKQLLATGDRYIEETNWWKDKYWGVCKGEGQNKLGIILMKTREFWR